MFRGDILTNIIGQSLIKRLLSNAYDSYFDEITIYSVCDMIRIQYLSRESHFKFSIASSAFSWELLSQTSKEKEPFNHHRAFIQSKPKFLHKIIHQSPIIISNDSFHPTQSQSKPNLSIPKSKPSFPFN